jgi:hypothetical protein
VSAGVGPTALTLCASCQQKDTYSRPVAGLPETFGFHFESK